MTESGTTSGNGKNPGKGNGKSSARDENAANDGAAGAGAGAAGAGTAAQSGAGGQQVPPEVAERIAQVRRQLREAFGTVAMAMMLLPRYRHQSLADLQHLLLEPLLNDRVAIARRAPGEAAASGADASEQAGAAPLESDIAGIAIWASVSEEVDAKIREQIRARVFPVRLKPDEWNSGDINWLFDIIAPDRQTATNIVVNFRQVVKDAEVRLHPILRELLDKDILEKLRRPADAESDTADVQQDGQASH